MRWAIPLPLALAACMPPPPEVQGPAPAHDPDAPALTEDGYRAGQRADGSFVFDVRYTAPDVTKIWINDVAECIAAKYAVDRGYASAAKVGQGEVTIEAGEGFPRPVMQGSYVYRLDLEGSGAAETAARCEAEGVI